MPHPNTSLPLPRVQQAPAHIRALEVFLTNRCNMSCANCAVLCAKKPSEHRTVSWDDLKAGIDTFLDPGHVPYKGKKALALAGGEPFLVYDLVLKAVRYASEKPARPDIILFTNGTLAKKDKVEKLRSLGVNVVFSIDGDKKGNDLYRKFRGGRKSVWDAVMKNLEALPDKEGLSTNTVIRPGSLPGLLDALKHFRSMGFRTCDLWIDYFHVWKPEELRELERFMAEFTDFYVSETRKAGELPFYMEQIHHALYNALFLDMGKVWWRSCFRLILGADGSFYDCQGTYPFPYDKTGSCAINLAAGGRGADWSSRQAFMNKAEEELKQLGADKDWQHVCPRCYVKVLGLMGGELEPAVENLHAVSRVFIKGLVRLAERLKDERCFAERYIEQPLFGVTEDELGPPGEVRARIRSLLAKY